MRKILCVCLLAAGLIGVFSLPSLYAAGKEAPADKVMKAPEGAAATQSPVTFSHKTHAMDCKTCHHKLDANKDAYGCSGKGCHDSADMADKSSEKSFYRAFHDPAAPNSCLGCHKKEKAAGKDKAPVVCTQCHPKKAA
ncbi:MAG: cytochrome c3 family protein [Desulfovibrionaceae bacterium]|nr:cytochrome c3 family protein [Desulfovibrionaceae bacterium]MBF0514876.1 cytochrome c3 family protein [Desulfovibrionaceae bacterium]